MRDHDALASFSEAVELLHLAAAGSSDWQTAAGALRRVAGCDVLNVLTVAMDRRIVDADCSGMSRSEKRDYFENWAAMDELAAAAFALPGGTAHSLSERLTLPAIRVMEVFEAWYVPTGLHYGGAFHLEVPGFGHSAISMFNALERGAIQPDQLRRLDLLGRHFAGALGTAALVASARRQRAGVAAMLAQWSVGLLFCDPEGRVHEALGISETLLQHGAGGLRLRGGRLRVDDPGADRRLRALLRNPRYGTSYAGPSVALHGAAGDDPVECTVLAFGEAIASADDRVSVERGPERLVIVRASPWACGPDPHFLRRRLGLTPTETDVLWRLMLGDDLPAIAAHRQSSTETVRSCLKGLRRKLECHTQAQLVAAAWRAVGLVPTARADGLVDDRGD